MHWPPSLPRLTLPSLFPVITPTNKPLTTYICSQGRLLGEPKCPPIQISYHCQVHLLNVSEALSPSLTWFQPSSCLRWTWNKPAPSWDSQPLALSCSKPSCLTFDHGVPCLRPFRGPTVSRTQPQSLYPQSCQDPPRSALPPVLKSHRAPP